MAGYGITDAAPLDHGIHVPSGGSNGTFLRGDLTWQAISGLGGIVAYSLNQNGYVKFGCGLILQWGTCGSGINNLPLRFNEKIFICVVTDITSSTTSSDGYFSFNNDKSTINSIFITSSGAYGGNYIVAGV